MSVGQRLREFRKELGYKQNEFARKIGVKPQALYKYEKGLTETNDSLKQVLSTKFDMSIDWLLTGKGEKFIQDKSKAPISLKQVMPILTELAELEETSQKQILEYARTLRKERYIPEDRTEHYAEEQKVAEPAAGYDVR